jgi:catechol 2,3-dioxygenase-like lactoylglutathione lyase family enzyme
VDKLGEVLADGGRFKMQPQLSLITLGVADATRAKAFYREGFGWEPVFEMEDIAFFQMNGFVFGLWEKPQLEEDMQRPATGTGAFALAHNVASEADVDGMITRLAAAGATVLRAGDAPPHGGYRGYVADPDGHAWEIAWNPAWRISAEGYVTFAA